MKMKKALILATVGALSVAACSEENKTAAENTSVPATTVSLPAAVEAPPPIKEARNMVYVSVGRYPNMRQTVDKYVDIITDYNLAFINPTDLANGDVGDYNDAQKEDLKYVFDKVRKEKPEARIYLSFGGWRGKEFDLVYEEIARNPESRQNFINNIMALVERYGADGVDMDWEYPRVIYKDEYALFIRELANALHSKGKRLSAAIIGTKTKKTDKGDGAAYADSVLSDFDNINLMAYDIDFEDHSTYADAVESIRYWVKERGVPSYKAILGLPVYSRNGWVDYNMLVGDHPNSVPTADPANACRDTFVHKDKVNYYNGLPTIIKKTRLAMEEKLGGVMIWELPLDAYNDERLSIVKAIDTTLNNTDFKNYCDENGLSGTP